MLRPVLESKLTAAMAPLHMELVNESHMHSVPAGSESHWNLIIVSERFVGLSRVDRHRAVNAALADELARGAVHALTMKTLTPDEWRAAGGAVSNQPPPCRGGSKA